MGLHALTGVLAVTVRTANIDIDEPDNERALAWAPAGPANEVVQLDGDSDRSVGLPFL